MKTQNRLDNEARDCIRCKSKKREATNKICSSCRMKEWRKDNPGKIKAYLKKNDERIKKHRKNYYKENKEALNFMSKQCRQKNGYAYEKTPARKARARIRVMTNNKYPLKGHDCLFCDNPAENRHHTTEPMEVDKFVFLCKLHHDKIHGRNSVVEVKDE